jgi:hypothetical protein
MGLAPSEALAMTLGELASYEAGHSDRTRDLQTLAAFHVQWTLAPHVRKVPSIATIMGDSAAPARTLSASEFKSAEEFLAAARRLTDG